MVMERWRLVRGLRHAAVSFAAGILAVTTASCNLDSLLKSNQVPTDVTDPALTKTPEGALRAYYGTLKLFQESFGSDQNGGYGVFVTVSGLLSDELQPGREVVNGGFSTTPDFVDGRLESVAHPDPSSSQVYGYLQQVRGQAAQAIGLLTDYGPPTQQVLVGHAYALEGYAEVLLAELYCSGIPLSTVDYNGDFTLQPGSTTADVFTHAVALFDSAIALSGDSARFVQMATLGKGRALLNLGQFAAAAATVAAVPDAFVYNITYGDSARNLLGAAIGNFGTGNWNYSVSNAEGFNGLDYRSSGDPRTASRSNGPNTGTSEYGYPIFVPLKYASPTDPVPLASGIEARLIQAEAALQAGDVSGWLSILNQLRAGPDVLVPEDTIIDTLGVSGCGNGAPLCGHGPGGDDPVEFGQPAGGFPVPSGYALVDVDTTYPAPGNVGGGGGLCDQRSWYRPCYAGDSMVVYVYVSPAHSAPGMGTGGVAGLGELSDPGTADGRVDLQFRERAFWLFLTGHREGDLRRLIRQYGRRQDEIFPIGPYHSGLGVEFGTEVYMPVPLNEQTLNPLYSGCLPTDA